MESIYPRIHAAARAAGLEELRLKDFRFIYKYLVVPATVMLNPDHAAPLANVSPVVLGSLETPPVVMGVDIKDPPLTEKEYDCLVVLKKYEPNYVELPRLKEKTGLPRPDRILQGLADKHLKWAEVLDVWPGKRTGGRSGYGFKRPE